MKEKRSQGSGQKVQKKAAVRASITFPPALYSTLEEIAREKKVSLAWVVRDASERYVAERSAEVPRPDKCRDDGESLGPPMQRRLDAYDVLVRRNEAVSILDKVRAFHVGGKAEARLDACVQPETVRAADLRPWGSIEQGPQAPHQTLWLTAHLVSGAGNDRQERGVDR